MGLPYERRAGWRGSVAGRVTAGEVGARRPLVEPPRRGDDTSQRVVLRPGPADRVAGGDCPPGGGGQRPGGKGRRPYAPRFRCVMEWANLAVAAVVVAVVVVLLVAR